MTSTPPERDLVELDLPMPFEAALLLVSRAIESKGLKIFTQIDHAAGATAVGLAMPPTTVILYGRPESGTPVMLAVPDAALDLPLRVLVREASASHTVVAFHPIAATLARLGAPEQLLHRLDPAQQLLVDLLG